MDTFRQHLYESVSHVPLSDTWFYWATVVVEIQNTVGSSRYSSVYLVGDRPKNENESRQDAKDDILESAVLEALVSVENDDADEFIVDARVISFRMK
jgi:hypothetical protein